MTMRRWIWVVVVVVIILALLLFRRTGPGIMSSPIIISDSQMLLNNPTSYETTVYDSYGVNASGAWNRGWYMASVSINGVQSQTCTFFVGCSVTIAYSIPGGSSGNIRVISAPYVAGTAIIFSSSGDVSVSSATEVVLNGATIQSITSGTKTTDCSAPGKLCKVEFYN
jgi:hypothetical protein